jgi:uncharacterized protein (TIGR02996 family)
MHLTADHPALVAACGGHPERAALTAAALADPADHLPKLVLADWLEEHREPEAAARLRWWFTDVEPHLAGAVSWWEFFLRDDRWWCYHARLRCARLRRLAAVVFCRLTFVGFLTSSDSLGGAASENPRAETRACVTAALAVAELFALGATGWGACGWMREAVASREKQLAQMSDRDHPYRLVTERRAARTAALCCGAAHRARGRDGGEALDPTRVVRAAKDWPWDSWGHYWRTEDAVAHGVFELLAVFDGRWPV